MATILHENGRKFLKLSDVTPPNIPVSVEDVIIITQVTDRLDLLAEEYYNDTGMYKAIVMANEGIGRGTLFLEPGSYIRIPAITREEFDQITEDYNYSK